MPPPTLRIARRGLPMTHPTPAPTASSASPTVLPVLRVSVVVVAYGDNPHLPSCLAALRAAGDGDLDVEIVLVDNGDTTAAVADARAAGGVTVIDPGRNTGFAEGCNIGVAAATGDVVALVNPDVVVEPTTLARLAAVAGRPEVGIATASVRLGEDPSLINSAGNPVHFSGLAWAGGHGLPAERFGAEQVVASASGACCAFRRAVWDELGGFDPAYFAYHEDVELSLRCRLLGYDVVYVPDAVAVHHYEFSRNRLKYELLERNRWLTLTRIYSARTLAVLAPALLMVEVMVLLLAARQRWFPAKIAGYRWLLSHRREIAAGRARVQAGRRRPDRDLTPVLTGRLDPTNIAAVPGLQLVSGLLDAYWRLARRAV